MSNVDCLGLRIDLERAEEALTERLAKIEVVANPSQDAITVAAVERMLAAKREEAEDENIEDDFAGGTAGIDGAPLMTWRSHVAELISRLNEDGYERNASHLKRLADANSLKKPFTAADEANVIRSVLEYLATFEKKVSGNGGEPDLERRDTSAETVADETGHLSPAAIARRFQVDQGRLEGRLRRWRKSNLGGNWIENENRKPREPQFLYDVAAVREIIDALKT